MKAHYYFDWFTNALPKQVADLLLNDLPERKSLVTVSAYPPDDEGDQSDFNTITGEWLNPAGITFDEYHIINQKVSKEKAHELLRNASAIFLTGGYTPLQNAFINEYELHIPIKESNATAIMGASSGTMNMSKYWICSKWLTTGTRQSTEECIIYEGLGLDNFAIEAHFDPENTGLLENVLKPLSQKLDVYATCWDSTIRVKNGKIEIFGEVYLISGSKIQKM